MNTHEKILVIIVINMNFFIRMFLLENLVEKFGELI